MICLIIEFGLISQPFIPGDVNVGRGSSNRDSLPDPEDPSELCGLISEDSDKLRGFAEYMSSYTSKSRN